MPMQVPDSFVPNVGLSPNPATTLGATGVDPMRNMAPQQQEQMGAAVSGAGQVTDSIGERIQWQLDDAKTKMAETQFLQNAMRIVHGDGTAQNPGYLNQRGQAALDQYPAAADALAKAKQAGMDSLSNNFQKLMFNRVTTAHLMTLGTAMADHHFQQGTEFAINAAQTRAEMQATLAANAYQSYAQTDADGNVSGDFNKFAQISDQEILQAQKQKIGTDDPTAAQNQYALLQNHSGIVRTALAQMLNKQGSPDQVPYTQVQDFFDRMKERGWIDSKDETMMANAVRSYCKPEQLNDQAAQALQDTIRSNHPQPANAAGPADVGPVIKGAGFTTSSYDKDAEGVHITVPQNNGVLAPASGTVTAAGKNDDGVAAIQITHPDGSISTLTGINAFEVKTGDTVRMGQQVGLSGDEGSQKQASVLWQMTDKNGKAIDPTKAGLPPVDQQQITDEKDLTDALQLFRARVINPNEQKEGTKIIESIVRQNQWMEAKAAQQRYQDAGSQFYGYALQHGNQLADPAKSIDPDLFHSLTKEQQYEFTIRAQNAQGGPSKEDNTDTVADFIQHPEQVTVNNVLAARGKLTDSSFLSWLKTAKEKESSAPKQLEAKLDAEDFNAALLQNGFQNLVAHKPGSPEQAQYIELGTHVRDEIEAAQNATGKPLSRDQKQQITDGALLAHVQMNGVFGSVHNTPFLSVTPKNMGNATFTSSSGRKVAYMPIPRNVQSQIIQNRASRNLPISDEAIYNDWVNAGMPGSATLNAPQ